jgi:ParB-like chromosome segregation protein Spo0J
MVLYWTFPLPLSVCLAFTCFNQCFLKTYGIREPIKCRPGRDGGVEIISGHRRHNIGMQLNYPIPTIIEQIGDDDAQIQCVDCNLHRKDIPLSELARATEMKMDALKRKQGRRSKADILSGKEPIKRSDELVGEDL